MLFIPGSNCISDSLIKSLGSPEWKEGGQKRMGVRMLAKEGRREPAQRKVIGEEVFDLKTLEHCEVELGKPLGEKYVTSLYL